MDRRLWASVRSMSRASTTATLLLTTLCWAATPASAQETTTDAEAASSTPSITVAPAKMTQEQWWQVDLEEAQQRSRRTRNALIATSASFGVGAIIAGIGASQCQTVPSLTGSNQDELLCNNAGNVMLPLGGTIAGLSFIGMLTSGIMLGVANKRKREIQRDIRRSQYGRRLQWDVPSGALVF